MANANKKCDAEIGKPGQWRVCTAKAVVGRMSRHGTLLCYCQRHARRAVDPKPSEFIPEPGTSAVRL